MATSISTARAATGLLFRKPLDSRVSATKKEAKAPAMNTSPWAKLIMNRIP